MGKIYSSILITCTVSLLSTTSYGSWLKNIAHVTNSECLTQLNVGSKSALKYKIEGATERESQLIQKTVDTFVAHNSNGLERVLKRAKFKVEDGLKDSNGNHASGLTNVRKKKLRFDRKVLADPDVAVGAIAHEICHLLVIMNISGEYKNVYGAYDGAVPKEKGACSPSKYSKVTYSNGSRIEEIAEVCSAHLFAPGFVAKRSRACKRAHNFMQGLFRGQVPQCRPSRSVSL